MPDGDGQGRAATEPLHLGTYTMIVTAPGFEPAARMTVVPTGGATALGVIQLDRSGTDAPPIPGTRAIVKTCGSRSYSARSSRSGDSAVSGARYGARNGSEPGSTASGS